MMNYDNPPARLHRILEAGLRIDKDKICRTAWADIFGLPSKDTDAIFSALGRTMTLPAETAALVSNHFPSLVSGNEHWRTPLERAFFNQQLGGKWESFSQHITTYCIAHLATLAELFHQKYKSLMAESEAIEQLRTGLDELIQQIEMADIQDEVRMHLISELSNLRFMLTEYLITGSTPLIRQAEAIVGHMHRDKGFRDFMTNHEIGQRVLDNLNAVVGILTIIVAVSQIAAPSFSLLSK